MKRPTRIAAVTATTALLMAIAAVGVFSIQQAVAEATASSQVTSEAPVLMAAPAAPPVVDPVAVLGDPSSGVLPPVPTVTSTPTATPSATPTESARSSNRASTRTTARASARPSTAQTAKPRPSRSTRPTPTVKPTRASDDGGASTSSSEREREAAQESAEKAREAAQQSAEQAQEQSHTEPQGEEHEDD